MPKIQLSNASRGLKAIIASFVILLLASACGTATTETKTGLVGGSAGQRPPVARSGFLGDYSQLRPGGEGRAAMVYVNPKVKWSTYRRVLVDPVQFWSSDNGVPVADQKVLTSYFYNALRENLIKHHLRLADKPGPGVMELKVAITGATASTPVLRSVSVVVPQARVLNTAQSLATGSYAFVGSAQTEGQIVDSVTGERLAAAIDRREGGMSLQTAAQWKWGDAQNILDYWAEKTAGRIAERQERGRAGH